MDRSKIAKTSILMMIIVVLIGGYYYYLSTRNEKANSVKATEEKATEMTHVQELLALAKYKEYPTTPVQVIKYYNEITSCFYNDEYTEEELYELAQIARSMYDPELVANQSFDDYYKRLKDDIAVFKSGNITIYSTEVTPSTDVIYDTHHDADWAKLYCMYTLKSGTVYQSSREEFLLRKDSSGHWKIYGFRIAVDPQ